MKLTLWLIFISFWLLSCNSYLPADPNTDWKNCTDRAGVVFELCEKTIPTCSDSLDTRCLSQYNNDVRSCR